MFDKNLVHAIIGGKDLDCGSSELSVNLVLTHGHGCPGASASRIFVASRARRGHTIRPVTAIAAPAIPATIPIAGNMRLREMKYNELRTKAISSSPSPRS